MAPLGRSLASGVPIRSPTRHREECGHRRRTLPELTALISGDGALLLFPAAGLAATAFAILRDIPAQRQVVAQDPVRLR